MRMDMGHDLAGRTYVVTGQSMNPPQQRSLHEIFLSNGEEPIHKWLHYFDIYERHFRRFVGHAPTVLEIGIGGGGSLRMWHEYFGKGAQILGLDVRLECKRHEREGIEIFIGSQDDRSVLNAITENHALDIVIDDGSHRMGHLNTTFDHLYDRVSPYGVYLLEDLHTCYWERYGGGLRTTGSFIETTKAKIDELNACHTEGQIAPSRFTASTASICIYDSIVVFERAPQGHRRAAKTFGMEL